MLITAGLFSFVKARDVVIGQRKERMSLKKRVEEQVGGKGGKFQIDQGGHGKAVADNLLSSGLQPAGQLRMYTVTPVTARNIQQNGQEIFRDHPGRGPCTTP